MREYLKRNISSLVGGFSLVLCFLPLFFSYQDPPVFNTFFIPIIQSVFLLVSAILAGILIFKREKSDRRHLIPFTMTLSLLFIAEVMLHNELTGYITNVLPTITKIVQALTFIALIPLYVLLILEIRITEKHVPRNFKLTSLFVTVIVLLAFSPLFRIIGIYYIQNKLYYEFVFVIISIIIDADIIAITATLIYMQWKIRKPYLWILVCISWIFRFVADITKSYLIAIEKELIGSTPEYLYSVSFALILIGLIVLFERYEKPISIRELELERKQYQTLYEDMNVFAKDLVTVTSLLRHDLLNDLVVIQSGIDLFQETGKQEYLDRVIGRTQKVAERMDTLKSESMVLESLAIQPIELDPISNMIETFSNLKILSLPGDIKVNANRLLYPVVFNVIQNAFQHGGDNVEVEISCQVVNHTVIIDIADNGKGVSDEEKLLIFQQGYRGTDKGVSGMGLYLVKIVIDSYGGSISVKDNEPQGAVFTITLTATKK